jgi:hypothetical protein
MREPTFVCCSIIIIMMLLLFYLNNECVNKCYASKTRCHVERMEIKKYNIDDKNIRVPYETFLVVAPELDQDGNPTTEKLLYELNSGFSPGVYDCYYDRGQLTTRCICSPDF